MKRDAYFDLGLPADVNMLLRTPLDRRRVLRMGFAGIATLLAGCAAGGPPGAPPSSGPSPTSDPNACAPTIPGETAGPYPADGSNASNQTLNVLNRAGIVRANLRNNLSGSTVAQGVPTTLELTLINVNANCVPLANYALYAWHCDRQGLYSLYSNGVTGLDYCRGVQASDASGKVSFQTIFPACYAGRWPHVHFEIYKSLDTATSSGNVVHTSQLALPEDVCKTVYSSADGYAQSTNNLSQLTLATDNVFSDGATSQLATVTGDLSTGYTVKLTVGVPA